MLQVYLKTGFTVTTLNLISVILKRKQREMAFCSSDPVYKEDPRSKIFLVLVKPSRERVVNFNPNLFKHVPRTCR